METKSTSEKTAAPHRLLTWRTARRLTLGTAVAGTLIAAFYIVENWRGKRAWEDCRRALESRGASLNWNDFIPAEVPDEQNIFKAPRMTEWFVGRRSTDLFPSPEHPSTRSAGHATNAIQTEAHARDYLAWTEQLEPNLHIIREALKRPYARFDCDYQRPQEIDVPNFASCRTLAQTLAQRAHSHLLVGEPDKALDDLTLLHNFCRILEASPAGKPITLVAAMINVAIRDLYAKTVAEGLERQAWRDSHLAVLQHQLNEIDLAPIIVESFRSEQAFLQRVAETNPRLDLMKKSERGRTLMLKWGPRGWLYQNRVTYAGIIHGHEGKPFPERAIDLEKRTVAPREMDKIKQDVQENADSVAPYKFYAFRWEPGSARVVQLFARTQTSVDQTAIACALERYRIAHGEYPENLTHLESGFMTKLPHDLIGGAAFQYQRNANGPFTLYSIGWNEKDDGGTPPAMADGKEDLSTGDWTWPARR